MSPDLNILRTSRVLRYLPVFLIGAGLLYMVVSVRQIGDYGVETDFYGTFAPRALGILDGEFSSGNYGVVGPVYELVLALGAALGFPLFLFAKLLSVFCTVGTVLVWMRLADRFVDPRGAWAVPWLFMISPAFFRLGYLASSDALFLFVLSVSVLTITRASTINGLVPAILFGVLAVLVRYVALILPLFAVIWFFRRKGWMRLTGGYLAGFSGMLAVILGLSALLGEVPRPDFLFNIDYELTKEGADWETYHGQVEQRGSALETLAQNKSLLVSKSVSNIPGHLKTELLGAVGWPLGILALTGLVLLVLRRPGVKNSDPFRILGLWGLLFFPLLLVQSSTRYSLTQVPIYVMAGGWTMTGVMAWKRGRRITFGVVVLLMVAGWFFNTSHQIAYQERQPTAVLALANQAKGTVAPGATIMARKPHLSFLLRAKWMYFPDAGNLEQLQDQLRDRNVEYVLYDGNTYQLRPQFRYLNFAPYRPLGWTVVADLLFDGVLYKVNPEFFETPIPPDDERLRNLQNMALSASDPVPPARVLAKYLAETGRCRAALLEYKRLAKYIQLTDEEKKLINDCGGQG